MHDQLSLAAVELVPALVPVRFEAPCAERVERERGPRFQGPANLMKDDLQSIDRRNVIHDVVAGDGHRETATGHGLCEIAFRKCHARAPSAAPPTGDPQHSGRPIHAQDLETVAGKQIGENAGPASQIEYPRPRGQARQ